MSAEHRRKISERQKEIFLQRLTEQGESPTHKRCARCGEFKPVEAFTHVKRKLKSGIVAVFPHSPCKGCKVEEVKLRKERLRAEGVNLRAKQRQYEANEDRERRLARRRENEWVRRREEGRPVRGARVCEEDIDRRLPSAPIASFLAAEIQKHGMSAVEAFTGISARRLRGIREEEYSNVELSTVDRVLSGLGCPEKLQELYPAEEPKRLVGWHYLDPEGLLSSTESV